MKKFVTSLVACLAILQSAHAATPALTESLLEYEAITNAIGDPGFTVIPVTEFIVDIKRITKQINVLGEIRYKIVTQDAATVDDGCGCHNNRRKEHKYIAVLLVSPNPGIGPNIVEVLRIERVRR